MSCSGLLVGAWILVLRARVFAHRQACSVLVLRELPCSSLARRSCAYGRRVSASACGFSARAQARSPGRLSGVSAACGQVSSGEHCTRTLFSSRA